MFKNYWQFIKRGNHKILLLTGSFVWSLTMIKSGLVYSYGMGFWGPNGHDGIWHLSLIEGLGQFSLNMPIFAGDQIRNYHFGFDLLVALIHLVTRIPVRFLYFQIFPPLLAIAIGLAAYKFFRAWTNSHQTAMWGLFFVYFGGSFGWLVNFFRSQDFGGESMFWAQQSISTLLNPPFALSLFILFYILFRLVTLPLVLRTSHLVLLSLLIGSLAFIKIYASALLLPGLAVAAIREPKFRRLFFLSVLFSLLFYLPFNRSATSLIVWQPFWFLENLMALSDRFFWPKMYQAMFAYKSSHNYFKFIPSYSIAAAVFVLGNLGMRILGVLQLRNPKKWDSVTLLLVTSAALGFALPMFFLQRGTPWNTIQFFYYSQFIIGIFAAIWISKQKNLLLSVFCLLFTLPTTLDTLKHYLPSRPPAMISKEELHALAFLKTQPRGIVFTPPVSPNPYAPPPRPLYLYESTAYVSAFSHQPVYVEDTVNLNITGYPWQSRIDLSNNFMVTTHLETARNFLSQSTIAYIYLPEVSKVRPVFSASELGGTVIYENSQSAVWAIQSN